MMNKKNPKQSPPPTQAQLQEIAKKKMQEAADKKEAKASRFTEALDVKKFPMEKVSQLWRDSAEKAILLSAPFSFRQSIKELVKALSYDFEKGLSYYQFGVLSNALDTVSATALGLDRHQYTNLLMEAAKHIEHYGKEVFEIQKQVELEVETEFAARSGGSNTKSNGIMKPVMGQA